jgi:hypothetical protein
MSLQIDFYDLIRATLDESSGNVGYIGLSPDGSRYHVVVPVDGQIARGLKAGNQVLGGAPFGGYKDWHYFYCQSYSRPTRYDEKEINKVRRTQAFANAQALIAWAAERAIEVIIVSP